MTTLRRFSTVALAFLLTLATALPVSAGSIINAASVILSQDCTTANAIPYLTTASTTAAVFGCSNLVQSANSLDLYNGANVQSFGWYTTRTDASNYERGRLFGVAGTGITIAAETAGTGGDNLGITLTPAGTGNLTLASGQLLLPSGSSTAPSLMFGAIANGRAGIWEPASGIVGIGAQGQTAFFYADYNYGARLAAGWSLIFDNAAVSTAAPDAGSITLTRAAAATPYFYGSSTAVGATVRLGNTNVGYEDLARNSEAHTLAAAGTSTTATAVWPANSSSLAATFRITTEITGCTSVQVGVAGDATRYGTFSTLTAGQTIAIGRIDNYTAATGILFTAVGGGASFTAGVIRVNLRYVTASAPTS